MPRSKALAVLFSALAGGVAASVVDRFGPAPIASIADGSEDAFRHHGLDEREIPPRSGPLRWMGGAATVAFEDLPAGPVAVAVRLRSNAAPVVVAVNGAVEGVIAPDGPLFRAHAVAPRDGRVVVELRTVTMQRGDRQLGALIAFVRVTPTERSWRPSRLVVRLGVASGLAAAAALAAGLAAGSAAALGSVTAFLCAGALWPYGLGHSAYAARLPWLLAAAIAVAALVARLALRRAPAGSGGPGALLVALAAAFVVQGIGATSPVMVASDVVFHAHMLRDVAAGDWFPTSVTQHARPFRVPYGSAFYALLAPLARGGLDLVSLVRVGAGLGGCLAAVGLLGLLLPIGAARAALAVLLLQLLPGSFDAYSAGNLSNAFGQSMTVLFLAWWAGGTPLGPALGALLVALAGVSHLSSFLVLLAVIAALVAARRGRPGRVRALALVLGLGVAAWYYAHYVGLIVEQVPRLMEGGGQGRGAAIGFGGALWLQASTVLREWGIPVIVLLLFARFKAGLELERDLRAFACGAAALALPAIFSPVEVRYVLALGPAVAWLAAEGAWRLLGRGRMGRLAASALLLGQAVLGVHNLVHALLLRYR